MASWSLLYVMVRGVPKVTCIETCFKLHSSFYRSIAGRKFVTESDVVG